MHESATAEDILPQTVADLAGEPDQVARDVRAALLCPRPVVYTPLVWELVMAAISVLPRAVMRRIKF